MLKPQGQATHLSRPESQTDGSADGGSRLAAGNAAARDWSILGRRVLAEALHRATDELGRRHVVTPASAVSASPGFAPERRGGQS